jgi:hypothetical protein
MHRENIPWESDRPAVIVLFSVPPRLPEVKSSSIDWTKRKVEGRVSPTMLRKDIGTGFLGSMPSGGTQTFVAGFRQSKLHVE